MRRILALALVAGCGSDAATPGPDAPPAIPDAATPDAFVDQSGPVFEPDHIVDVQITMAPADWDAMRVQTRTFNSVLEGQCLAQPQPSPFTDFSASLTIDGTTFSQVTIHKKGFFGSLDDTKPSLKIDLGSGVEYLGLSKLTLNNSHQDPSYVRQCLAYETFGKAGIVVPRCNFAHVRVNGMDMGIYVNVETIDRKMMRKRYANGEGNLYEGTLSDFRTYWYTSFDAKAGGTSADRSDILPIVNAIESSSDATLASDLAPYLDVDKFTTYWAMETLTMHWDGYANDKNNFYIYHDPTSGKFEFIPWGPDATFVPGATFGGIGNTTGPTAVAASGMLANRLFSIASSQQSYLDRQRFMLNSVWDETAMLAEITRMQNLIAPTVDGLEGTGWHAKVDDVRSFVNNRRTQLTAALDAGPTWTLGVSNYPCLDVVAQVDGTFSTTWGTISNTNPFATGSGTFTITIGGVTSTLTPVGAKAGYDPNPPAGQSPQAIVQVFGQRASDGHVFAISVSMPPASFIPRAVSLGFFDAFGAVFEYNPTTMMTSVVGYTFGTMTLTQAATTAGAAVAGSFSTHADVQGTPP